MTAAGLSHRSYTLIACPHQATNVAGNSDFSCRFRQLLLPVWTGFKLRRMALTVEHMLYTECGATPHPGQPYAAGDAGLVNSTVQKPTVTRTQLDESGTD